jgi:hypothetical protein
MSKLTAYVQGIDNGLNVKSTNKWYSFSSQKWIKNFNPFSSQNGLKILENYVIESYNKYLEKKDSYLLILKDGEYVFNFKDMNYYIVDFAFASSK